VAWRRKAKDSGERPRAPQTGRPSANVFSYYSGDRANNQRASGGAAGRDGLETAQRERGDTSLLVKLPFLRFKYVPTIIAVTIIILSFFYLFSLNTDPRIIVLPESAPAYHTKTEYEQAAAALLASSPLNRTKLSINTTKFRKDFISQFPEAGSVNIALPVMGRRPVVTVEVMPPAAVLSNASTSYVLDTNARAVLLLSDAQSSLTDGLPKLQDESNIPLNAVKVVLDKAALAFATEIFAQFKAKKMPIQSIIVSILPNEIHVKPEGVPYYVKFDDSGNARSQAGAYFATRAYLDAKSITPAEYIDVRVPEKSYYK